MIEYVSDQLIASAKRRGRIPDGAFATAELLGVANEEIETYLVPLIEGVHEDYYETNVDFAVGPTSATYRIPGRAVGGSLREISFLDASGNTIDIPRVSIDDLEQATWGFTLLSQRVQYVNRVARAGPVTLRMTIALRPNRLCQAASAAVVTAINGDVLTLAAIGAPADPLLPLPDDTGPDALAAVTSFDIVKASPGFEIAGYDLAGSVSGANLTLSGDVPAGVEVGDYVARAGYSPVPQAPAEAWHLLAQAVRAELLSELGDAEAQNELGRLAMMEKRVKPLLQNRVRGAPQSVIRRHGVLQASRRW